MSNERLRAAIQQAGLQPEDLADQLQVDVKTVRRWLGGRTPHARYRAQTIHALRNELPELTEPDLWPEIKSVDQLGDDSRDLQATYLTGDDIRVPDWRTLLRDATSSIDLLDPTLANIVTTAGTVDLLAEKARAGASIRILISDPHSIWTVALAQQLGQEPNPDGATQTHRDIQIALEYLARLPAGDQIQIRTYWAERTLSVLRFDDDMLLTHHLHATPTRDSPTTHLHRHGPGGLFDRYLAHLDAIHDTASQPAELPTL